ncbi:MAG TPA: serine/threonine-protein kinase [Gemmataceae bacterium]|nr:serine/threonine-protein kinase [Gemmataceae bacterium]
MGRGGMGVVYEARQTVMNRQVVIKVINKSLLDNPEAVERFRREVQAAASLSHPNIVTAYDAEQAGDLHMLVMEFVPGQNLAEVLHKKGPLPVAHACHFVRQAALGLQHAFEQGMVHRDIKPQNLMLTPKGQVKVLDFGLARLRDAGPRAGGLTQTGAFMGTPEYVSPEQATDARTADIRADLYSLGCTLYFLLTGRPPFTADTAVKLVLAHIEKEPTPLRELRPDVPEALSAVVGRLLAKDPGQRYQTPVELAQALVPFIKAGMKGGSMPVMPQPQGVASPDKGTIIGADTSRIGRLERRGAGKGPTTPAAAQGAAADRFTKLVAPPDPRQKVTTSALVKAGPWARQWWLIGTAVAVLLVGIVGLWAGGVFKVKTKEGILVVQVNEPNPDVYVDGEKIRVSWDNGGKTAQIRVKPGTRKVEVKKDGFSVDGKELTFKDGDREIFTARLQPEQGAAKVDAPLPGKSPPLSPPEKPDKPPNVVTTAEQIQKTSIPEEKPPEGTAETDETHTYTFKDTDSLRHLDGSDRYHRIRPNSGGLEVLKLKYDPKQGHGGIRTKANFTIPIVADFEVFSLEDGNFDITVGLFHKVLFRWGIFGNTKSFVKIPAEREFEVQHLRIVANRLYHVTMAIDLNRNLEIKIDGVRVLARNLAANVDLKGPVVLLGGGYGHYVVQSLTVKGKRLNEASGMGGPGGKGAPAAGAVAAQANTAVAPAPVDQLRKDIDLAKAAYQEACKRIDRKLLAACAKEIEAVRAQHLKAEKQLQAIQALTTAKEAFEQDHAMPWSQRMRPAAIDYLRSLRAAASPLRQPYDRAIQHYTKAGSLTAAEELRAEKHAALAPRVVGTWACTAVGGPRQWSVTLYANGSANARDGSQRWELHRHGIVILSRDPAAPGGIWIDTCQVAADGFALTARNQKGFRFTAKLER